MANITMTYGDITVASNKMKTILVVMKDLSKRLEKVGKSVKTMKDYETVSKSILTIQNILDDQIDYVTKLRSTLDSIAQRYQGSESNAQKIVDDIEDDFELKSVTAANTFTDVFAKQLIAAAQYIWSTLYPGDTLSQDVTKWKEYVLTQDGEAMKEYAVGKIKEIEGMAYNVVNSAVQQVSFGAVTLNDLASIDKEKISYLRAAVGAYKDNYYQLDGRQDFGYVAQGAKVNNYFQGLITELESKQ